MSQPGFRGNHGENPPPGWGRRGVHGPGRSELDGLNGASDYASFGEIYLDVHWINEKMVREGRARYYVRYSDRPQLAACEKATRKARAGCRPTTSRTPSRTYRHRKSREPQATRARRWSVTG
jgi:hypothetical protein